MSNANKSKPEDAWHDEVELPNEDDFSLAALEFLSADLSQPTNGAPPADDFFDTGALTSLASLGWRDTDSAVADESPSVPADAQAPPASAELLDLAESMTGPSLEDDAPVPVVEQDHSFTQSVPDDEDGLLELAESFTQSTPEEIEASLLNLAESFTGAVLDTGAVSSVEIDDDAPTVVLPLTDEIAAVQAALSAQIDVPVETEDDDLLSLAEAATATEQSELTALDEAAEEAFLLEDEVDETDNDIRAIAEAVTEPQLPQAEQSLVLDDELRALAEDSAARDEAFDEELFFDGLLDLSADEALDNLFDDGAPTDAEFDALLDNESRYLDQIVAGLDAESERFETEEEAQAIELLTARQKVRTGEQYVVFTLDDTAYGIPVANVLEVGEPQAATHVPFVPHWVRGIINLRGEIVSLVDLRGFLHGVNGDDNGWMIISQTRDEGVTVGLLVDDVRGNRQFSSQQQTEVAVGLTGGSVRFLQKVFEENGQMIAALDFDRLLNSAEMRQFEAM